MLASSLFRWLALVVPLISGAPFAGHAQTTGPDELLIYHVNGLSSADRDALVHSLAEDPDLRVVFACVPAGLIAFKAATEGQQARTEELLGQYAESGQAERSVMDMRSLEEACSQHRGQ